MLNIIVRNPAFVGSALYRSFSESPLGFIDIGARGGAHELIGPAAEVAAVMCFEPDPVEFERLELLAKTWPFATTKVVPAAISDRIGEATFYLTRNPNNNSLLKPDANFAARFGNNGLDIISELKVATTTLDNILNEEQREVRWGEVIKIDAQGADFRILQGATTTLASRTVAVVCEALFMDMYEEQHRFSDIEIFLRQFGFSFYGFIETNMRSRRLLDKRSAVGRERWFWGDAVFLKDPICKSGVQPHLSDRDLQTLFMSALFFRYYDFALEIVQRWPALTEGLADVQALVNSLGQYDPHQTARDVSNLARAIETDLLNANVYAGRYVDARRTNFDYRDVSL